MKITRFGTTLVNVPLETPIATAIHQIESTGCVLLELETDQGLVGESYVQTLNAVRLGALREMLCGFAHQVKGRDPHMVAQIWQDIWNEMNPIGHKGFSIAALTAIDTACWDLVGKAAGLPLYKVFGACREKVKTYASGGLWMSQSIDGLVEEAAAFIDAGFLAMKLRLGKTTIAEDIERVRAVRDAIGPDIELLADANQSLTVKHAIRLGRELEQFDLLWFEEPVVYHNLAGCAEVRAALATPIAAGETEYTRYGMRDILEAGAVDVLMPDLQRIGGLSEMRRVAALASAYEIPISTHLFTEHSLSIAGAEANCISVEHMPWNAPLFNEAMDISDGMIIIPDRPGTGFSFDRKAIKRFSV
ncbi:MAG: mandelate racemase/muconate lactonizing enzyme family protein [Gammaproteobacteria bacterium]|nr:mandelate racemase/muconate lactonizing enzyme family protein [Gammaproteobacteria bacterium]MDH3537536.1 mandelate racemase/muconate lactonizing enzyme family protein [Gammaproteobacteria bacterium]